MIVLDKRMEKRSNHAYVVAGHSLILEFGSGRVNMNTAIESLYH